MLDPVLSIAEDELRGAFRAARSATETLVHRLDAIGHGDGLAIELADEARECLTRAEETHYKMTRPRSTVPVDLAVRRARERAARERDAGSTTKPGGTT